MDNSKELTQRDNKSIDRGRELSQFVPAVDIFENENEILLQANMPGVLKDHIALNIDNGTLSISGVRRLATQGAVKWEEFSDVEYVRSFSVPQTIDVEKVQAELKNGVLQLHLPKSEAAKPRQIEIQTT